MINRSTHPNGLDKIEYAVQALDVIRNMCGELEHLSMVSGDGLVALLHFVSCGIEDGLKEQRDEERGQINRLRIQAERANRFTELSQDRRKAANLRAWSKKAIAKAIKEMEAEARDKEEFDTAVQAELSRLETAV